MSHAGEVESCDLWQVVGEAGHPQEHVRETAGPGRGPAALIEEHARGAHRADHLLRVGAGERRQPGGGFIERVRNAAARAKHDQRPEDGLGDDADQHLDAGLGGVHPAHSIQITRPRGPDLHGRAVRQLRPPPRTPQVRSCCSPAAGRQRATAMTPAAHLACHGAGVTPAGSEVPPAGCAVQSAGSSATASLSA